MTSLLPPASEPAATPGTGPADDAETGKPPTDPGPRPAAIGALLAVGWTAPTGALLCAGIAVTGWLLGGQADATTAPAAVRLGTNAWLLTHHASIEFADGTFGLAPLGLCALLTVICFLAGGWIARTCDLRRTFDVGVAICCFALCYGGFAALVALLSRSAAFWVSPWQAAWNAGLLAGLGVAAGVLTERGDLAHWVGTSPPRLRSAVRAAGYGLAVLLGAATLLLMVALGMNADRITEFGKALHPGFSGWLVLALLCLVYLPNAVVYVVSYLLGPGFALGVGTVVSPTAVVLGPLPTFPLLAAVPQNGAAASWLLLVLLVPLGAGVFAGTVLLRRHPDLSPRAAALYGGCTGGLIALTVAGLVTLASGSAGPGRMADFGGTTALVLLTAILLCTSGSVVATAALPCWRRWGSPRLRSRFGDRLGSPPYAGGHDPVEASTVDATGDGIAEDGTTDDDSRPGDTTGHASTGHASTGHDAARDDGDTQHHDTRHHDTRH